MAKITIIVAVMALEMVMDFNNANNLLETPIETPQINAVKKNL